MLNRFIAAIGVLAFALAYLPAGAGWCAAAEPMSCCTGKMCPMLHHRAAAKHSDCGMASMSNAPGAIQNSSATMCSCTGPREIRYVGAMLFVMATSPNALSEPVQGRARILGRTNELNSFPEPLPPPPKNSPALIFCA